MLTEIREIRVQKSTCTRITHCFYRTRITRTSCLVSKNSRDSSSKINTQYYFLVAHGSQGFQTTSILSFPLARLHTGEMGVLHICSKNQKSDYS